MNSATAACLRAAACASTRSHAAITPATSSSPAPRTGRHPRPPRPANPASAPHPGMVSSSIPAANPAARERYSPGARRADPGWPGPRRQADRLPARQAQPGGPRARRGLLRGDAPALRHDRVQVALPRPASRPGPPPHQDPAAHPRPPRRRTRPASPPPSSDPGWEPAREAPGRGPRPARVPQQPAWRHAPPPVRENDLNLPSVIYRT